MPKVPNRVPHQFPAVNACQFDSLGLTAYPCWALEVGSGGGPTRSPPAGT
jgi:hypothetical protein